MWSSMQSSTFAIAREKWKEIDRSREFIAVAAIAHRDKAISRCLMFYMITIIVAITVIDFLFSLFPFCFLWSSSILCALLLTLAFELPCATTLTYDLFVYICIFVTQNHPVSHITFIVILS